MKFSFTLIFLIFIIAVVQAAPMQKRALGSAVTPLGVRFKDLYASFTSQVKKVDKKFYKEIDRFNEKIPAAAKADGTDDEDVQWLLTWNEHYKTLVDTLDQTTKQLDTSIGKLAAKLK